MKQVSSIRRKNNCEPRRWTKQAIYCYRIGAKCSECQYNIPLESIDKCQMKNSVLALVRIFGKPDEDYMLLEDNLKRCALCKEVKPLSEFHVSGNHSKSSYCNKCANKLSKLYRDKQKQMKIKQSEEKNEGN